jgi:hypothetical protein
LIATQAGNRPCPAVDKTYELSSSSPAVELEHLLSERVGA